MCLTLWFGEGSSSSIDDAPLALPTLLLWLSPTPLLSFASTGLLHTLGATAEKEVRCVYNVGSSARRHGLRRRLFQLGLLTG